MMNLISGIAARSPIHSLNQEKLFKANTNITLSIRLDHSESSIGLYFTLSTFNKVLFISLKKETKCNSDNTGLEVLTRVLIS